MLSTISLLPTIPSLAVQGAMPLILAGVSASFPSKCAMMEINTLRKARFASSSGCKSTYGRDAHKRGINHDR